MRAILATVACAAAVLLCSSTTVSANENVLELGDGKMDIAKTTPTFVKFYAPVMPSLLSPQACGVRIVLNLGFRSRNWSSLPFLAFRSSGSVWNFSSAVSVISLDPGRHWAFKSVLHV